MITTQTTKRAAKILAEQKREYERKFQGAKGDSKAIARVAAEYRSEYGKTPLKRWHNALSQAAKETSSHAAPVRKPAKPATKTAVAKPTPAKQVTVTKQTREAKKVKRNKHGLMSYSQAVAELQSAEKRFGMRSQRYSGIYHNKPDTVFVTDGYLLLVLYATVPKSEKDGGINIYDPGWKYRAETVAKDGLSIYKKQFSEKYIIDYLGDKYVKFGKHCFKQTTIIRAIDFVQHFKPAKITMQYIDTFDRIEGALSFVGYNGKGEEICRSVSTRTAGEVKDDPDKRDEEKRKKIESAALSITLLSKKKPDECSLAIFKNVNLAMLAGFRYQEIRHFQIDKDVIFISKNSFFIVRNMRIPKYEDFVKQNGGNMVFNVDVNVYKNVPDYGRFMKQKFEKKKVLTKADIDKIGKGDEQGFYTLDEYKYNANGLARFLKLVLAFGAPATMEYGGEKPGIYVHSSKCVAFIIS